MNRIYRRTSIIAATALLAGSSLAFAASTETEHGYTLTANVPLVLGSNANGGIFATTPRGPGGRLSVSLFRNGSQVAHGLFVVPKRAGNFKANVTAIGICKPLGPRVTLTTSATLTLSGNRGVITVSRSAKRVC
jgi:hypothetical protein